MKDLGGFMRFFYVFEFDIFVQIMNYSWWIGLV